MHPDARHCLIGFLEQVKEDRRLTATHIALYVVLWKKVFVDKGKAPTPIKRQAIMKGACILSRQTYYKRLNELCQYGYIECAHTGNGTRGTWIHLLPS